MVVFWSLIFSVLILVLNFPVIKIYQLENYNIKNTLKKLFKFQIFHGDKNKLIFTKRVIRFIFAMFFVLFLINLSVFLLKIKFYLKILITILILIFIPIVFSFVHILLIPIEISIKKSYIKKAKKKLNSLTCKKIAITGSFGKTTTKNFLFQILSQKFKVCMTPKSFNTPMGICKTILENLSEEDNFFVVEMGARHKGDIDFLCKMIGVDYGILTAVGNCHIESFKNLQTVEDTKFELCENTNDFVVINGKNLSGIKLYERCKIKKYLVCQQNSFAYAQNISIENGVTKFELVVDGKKILTETKLLGKTNIDNITTASALCYLLGVSLYDIDKGIKELKAIPHRMEILKGNCLVIDDSYNSNFDGFCEALDVLSNFEGRKIVVTPGMVELGKLQYDLNYKIAKRIAKCCDEVVIMNKVNSLAISAGLSDENFAGNIHYANTREELKNILKKIVKQSDVVLFENDLPDNYR